VSSTTGHRILSPPRLVIVESPFAATAESSVERNIRYLRACLRDCIALGESPYASHGLLTQPGVLDDANPEDRDRGIWAGFAWRGVADRTVVYTDLGITRGMQTGIHHARHIGHQVEYRELGKDWESAATACATRWP
jgi:hypothetical protein